jgi:hypothetical protein
MRTALALLLPLVVFAPLTERSAMAMAARSGVQLNL